MLPVDDSSAATPCTDSAGGGSRLDRPAAPTQPTAQPAARVRPEDVFSAAEWVALSARSRWVGLALVAHCWAVIGAAIAVGVLWPITLPLVIVVVGNRQLGLFVLMHEAAHGLMHPNRRINDTVARWLCRFDLHGYRAEHLQHHRYVQQALDPDLPLSAKFPVSPESLRRKLVRDLTGQTFYQQRFARLRADLAARPAGVSGLSRTVTWISAWRAELRRQPMFYAGNAAFAALFAAFGLAWAWLLMWLLPLATWLMLIARIRNIAEHALLPQGGSDPYQQARTVTASRWERILIAPYRVNFHSEHHLFTQIPCWRLPQAHALLRDKGLLARMEIQPSYQAVLNRAVAAQLTK